jgi:hypothetical protein
MRSTENGTDYLKEVEKGMKEKINLVNALITESRLNTGSCTLTVL